MHDLLEALKRVTNEHEQALRAVGIYEGTASTRAARAAIQRAGGEQ